MNSRGFTMVEMLIVMTIIAIIAGIATMNWNRMVTKSTVEGQIKTVHADIMSTRLEALYSKRPRAVTFSGNVFSIYSSDVTTAAPVASKTFKYGFISNFTGNKVVFDTSGMANGEQGTVCVDVYGDLLMTSDAYVDSLVVSQARVNLAKRPEGGQCNATTSGVTQR